MIPKDFLFTTRRYIDGVETPLIQREETAEFIISYVITELGFGTQFFDLAPNSVRMNTSFLNIRDESSIIALRSPQDMSRIKRIFDMDKTFIAGQLSDEQKHVSHLLLKQRNHDTDDEKRFTLFSARGYRVMLMLLGDENPQGWVDARISEEDLVSALTQYLFEGATKVDLLDALTTPIKRNLAGVAGNAV